jgi:phenylacetate-CoA ligase
MFASRFYHRAPTAIQTTLLSLWAAARRRIRESSICREQLRQLRQSQWLDERSLSELQRRQLAQVAMIAGQTVPFYQKKLGPTQVGSIDAITQFPIIDKATVKNNPSAFLSSDYKGIRFSGTTSGTTGTPLTLYLDFRALNLEQAFIARHLEWAGYSPPGSRAWIRGEMIVPLSQTDKPFWRMNKPQQMLMMSSYHLSVENAGHYIKALRDHAPTLIEAYPSSIGFLAQYLAAHSRYFPGDRLKAIVTSSETLTLENRRKIEERFGCKVFDWYGARERVAAIGQCEHGRYHLIADYGYTEFMPAQNGWSEIVATGFSNRLMPLLRYRTGDYVTTESPEVCPCGRKFPTIKALEGRRDDYLKTPDGRFVGRMDHIYKGIEGVAEAQIIQEHLHEIRIRVVPLPGFDRQAEKRLKRKAAERLGSAMRVEIEPVAALPRTKQGKFQSVICRI